MERVAGDELVATDVKVLDRRREKGRELLGCHNKFIRSYNLCLQPGVDLTTTSEALEDRRHELR